MRQATQQHTRHAKAPTFLSLRLMKRDMRMSSDSITQYRIRCTSENANVFVWSSHEPTECPNDASHDIDSSLTVAVDTVSSESVNVANLPLTPFDRVMCAEETVLIDIKPGMGVSRLRDDVSTQGSGAAITNNVGEAEFKLQVANAGDACRMRTVERGPYVSGLCAEVGIGGHLASMPTGNQTLRFGAFDDQNGFAFEINASGLAVLVIKDGAETHRCGIEDFNIDTMDGTGPSRLALNPLRGYVWCIRWSWYGYGAVEFAVVTENINMEQHVVPMHRYYTKVRASISTPNLPISVQMSSGSTAAPFAAYVTGRKFSLLGKYTPTDRTTNVCALFEAPTSTAFSPAPTGTFSLCWVRRRATCSSIPARISAIEITSAGGPIQACIDVVAAPPSNLTWGAVPGTRADETILEYAQGASAPETVTTSVSVWRGFANALPRANTLDAYVPEKGAMLVRILDPKGVRGLVSVCLRVNENW